MFLILIHIFSNNLNIISCFNIKACICDVQINYFLFLNNNIIHIISYFQFPESILSIVQGKLRLHVSLKGSLSDMQRLVASFNPSSHTLCAHFDTFLVCQKISGGKIRILEIFLMILPLKSN